MKKIKFNKKTKALIASLVVMGQVVASSILPQVVNAGVVFPKEVTVEYD